MKKLFSLALVMAMFLGLGVTAFAEEMPPADPDPDVVYPGSVVRIYTEDFYWEDDDGDWVPLDCELDKEYFSGVTPRWKKGKDYIERVYFDDGDDYVTIIIRDDISVSSEKEIYGTLRIRDTDARRNYECEIEEGSLTLAPYEKSNMEYLGDREFTLPWDYQSNEVKFVTEDGERIRRLRESLARNQVKDFLEGMYQLGFQLGEIVTFVQTEGEKGHHEHSGV